MVRVWLGSAIILYILAVALILAHRSVSRTEVATCDMRDQRPDVSPEVRCRQVERYRFMSPGEKLSLADSLWNVVWSATQAGVRMRHPEFDARQVEQAARLQLHNATD